MKRKITSENKEPFSKKKIQIVLETQHLASIEANKIFTVLPRQENQHKK